MNDKRSREDNLKLLLEEIKKHKKGQDDLIEVLHKTQELFGYIPQEAISLISKELEVYRSVIYGVITFYHFFTLQPPSRHTIKVCLGTACYVKGADRILSALKKELEVEVEQTTEDGLFKIQGARCLGACGLAPVMMVDEEVYGKLTEDKVREIIKEYRETEAVVK
ncbi:MAG: NAD(P)H-dependent oxidoreductase subunit E [bacterium]|nr:NAD(P)H-dependent oxidoreductase subunit E [bacterium]